MLKSQKGITLVALVVTIVVLLILAAVALNLTLGENGLITKAKDTKTESEKAEIFDQIALATSSGEIEYSTTGTSRLITYKSALLSGVDGIDSNSVTDNGSNLITGTVTKSSGKKYDFQVPVPVTDITVAEHVERVLEVTSVYAKLYSDGTLILSSSDYTDTSKTLTNDFGLVVDKTGSNYWSASPYKEQVTTVKFYDEIIPSTTAHYFTNLSNLESFENMSYLETGLSTSMQAMFWGCTSLTSIDVSHFNTSNVTNMSGMFAGSYSYSEGVTNQTYNFTGSLTSLDLSNFNTGNVTNMSYMFEAQPCLESIILSSFNTENVTTMGHMFYGCVSITELDLSSFDTSSITNVSGIALMFATPQSGTIYDRTGRPSGNIYAYYNGESNIESALEKIYVSDLWDLSGITAGQGNDSMFSDCVSLEGAVPYNANQTNRNMANYTTGYLTKSNN